MLPVEESNTVEIDYEEVTTIKNLYDKYSGKIDGPLIVQRTKWYGDYAFVVEELIRNETWANGMIYKGGTSNRSVNHHADTVEFRMYNGPSAAKIKAAHKK